MQCSKNPWLLHLQIQSKVNSIMIQQNKKFGVFEGTAWSYFNNAEEMSAALALKLDVATYNEYIAANDQRVKAVEDDLAAYKNEVAGKLAEKG